MDDRKPKPKKGDIYWITANPYRPPVGRMISANRPAVIVSNDELNKTSELFEIVYLTTAPKRDLNTHCTIRSTNTTSTAICEQITTVGIEQLQTYITRATEQEMQYIDACIAISLGLDSSQQPEHPDRDNALTQEELSGKLQARDNELAELRLELMKTQVEKDTMTKLYNDLMQKVMRRNSKLMK